MIHSLRQYVLQVQFFLKYFVEDLPAFLDCFVHHVVTFTFSFGNKFHLLLD
jgi:hypothetical protein